MFHYTRWFGVVKTKSPLLQQFQIQNFLCGQKQHFCCFRTPSTKFPRINKYWRTNSSIRELFVDVFMLTPVQFAESQMVYAGISEKTAANKPKMPFCANPVLQGAENRY
jgi:hypothetical protein